MLNRSNDLDRFNAVVGGRSLSDRTNDRIFPAWISSDARRRWAVDNAILAGDVIHSCPQRQQHCFGGFKHLHRGDNPAFSSGDTGPISAEEAAFGA